MQSYPLCFRYTLQSNDDLFRVNIKTPALADRGECWSFFILFRSYSELKLIRSIKTHTIDYSSYSFHTITAAPVETADSCKIPRENSGR